jgi:hypothetical protein
VGWSGEARGPRGGATGGAALTFAPGRAAGAVFSRGVLAEISGLIEPAGSAGLGPAKIKICTPLVYELQHQSILAKWIDSESRTI